MESFSLRLARPDELQQLIAIDDEASELYAQAGLNVALAKDHPFVVAESTRWAGAIERGAAHVAVNRQDQPLGFVTLGLVDDEPYLDQLAVRPGVMRRGIGTALLRQALSWSTGRPLWLTTYSHLPWNGPYYQRNGFVSVPDGACAPELRAILEEQRAALPEPGKRIAMVRRHYPGDSIVHSHHSIDYIEFTVHDLPAARRFYSEAFGWKFTDYGPTYAGIQGSDREVGGICQSDEVRTTGPLVILYSDDLEASAAAVVAAGGKILKSPFAFPGGRRFHFSDLSGNELAVWSEK